MVSCTSSVLAAIVLAACSAETMVFEAKDGNLGALVWDPSPEPMLMMRGFGDGLVRDTLISVQASRVGLLVPSPPPTKISPSMLTAEK